jgi:hypothetical protein
MAKSGREKLLETIELRWDELLTSVEGLSDEEMQSPGVVGDWSVKDILAHITTWETEALKHLPEIAAGKPQQRYKDVYGGLDAFNALTFKENRVRSLSEVRTRLTETHQQLLDYLDTVPDELLHSRERFRTRLRWDTYSHYPIHAAHIREWRARFKRDQDTGTRSSRMQ